VQDLWMLLAGARHEQELQLAELLDGYETFCPFDNATIALIEPLRALRMAHYAGWLTVRRGDPAFRHAFSWFGDDAYWRGHVAELEEQLALLAAPPLRRL
jgi:Ser/Thr protein kinase RdoA (MazF antagonist)